MPVLIKRIPGAAVVSILCYLITGCPVPIYKGDVPAVINTPHLEHHDLDSFKVAPFYYNELVRQFQEEIIAIDPTIEVVNSSEVWKMAFSDLAPDAEVSMLDLIQNEALNCLNKLGVNYVVSVTPIESQKEEPELTFIVVGFHGSQKISSKFKITVVRLNGSTSPECIEADATGTETATWIIGPYILFFYFLVLKDTEHSVLKEMAKVLVSNLQESNKSPPIRILIMGSIESMNNDN